MRQNIFKADIAVIGGGTGGCAAALAALRQGKSVVLTEETAWIGGQLTSQAVPPDEHPWIEEFGCTASYRHFRNLVRSYYKTHYPLTTEASAKPDFNPGNAWVSRLSFEPRVALAVLEQMMAPWVASGRLVILRRHRPIDAGVSGNRVTGVRLRDLDGRGEVDLLAPCFLDATETGELLPMTGAEYVIGAESRRETGEPHAAETADPRNQQAVTWCFAVEYCPMENYVGDPPEDWELWRDFLPKLTPAWPGRLLDWLYTNPFTKQPHRIPFDPATGDEGTPGFWTYRRMLDHRNFAPGFLKGDVCLVNWPQNDYLPGPLVDVSPEEAKRHRRGAAQLSLCLFHWLQTEAPRLDGGRGFPELRLRGDLTGTTHGLAMAPYIRESRRIRADFTVKEQHVSTEARREITGLDDARLTAESFPDSVGLGCYRIDLHPSTGGDNYIDISSLPFEIPLGALIPQRMENLIPAAKNIGTTHITNGCYRLHPVEWNIGEAAGALAAHSLRQRLTPREIRNSAGQLAEFQALLERDGVSTRWPRVRPV